MRKIFLLTVLLALLFSLEAYSNERHPIKLRYGENFLSIKIANNTPSLLKTITAEIKSNSLPKEITHKALLDYLYSCQRHQSFSRMEKKEGIWGDVIFTQENNDNTFLCMSKANIRILLEVPDSIAPVLVQNIVNSISNAQVKINDESSPSFNISSLN